MNDQRPRQGNGASREVPRRVLMTEGHGHEALGDVARDVMDHVSMIVRDEAKIAKLSVRRYAEHVREDVAPKALFTVGAAVCGALAVVMGLIALFLGIAYAIGSVGWTFAIFAAAFAVVTVVMAGMVKRPRVERAEDISKRFPSVSAREGKHEHALARQATPEGHREVTREAEREASREMLSPRSAVITAEDQARRVNAQNGERRPAMARVEPVEGPAGPASRVPPA